MIYIQLCVVQECNLKFHITSIAEALLLYGIWYIWCQVLFFDH